MGSTRIDLTHLQNMAAAGELTKDHALLAEVETLLGRVLAGGTAIALNRYDFYPTPQFVVKLALDGLAETGHKPQTILEPSCGTGAWLDEIMRRWPDATIHVVEKNPLNRLALKDKEGIELVGDDFLIYEPMHGYDLIVGNPPFGDDGDKLTWAKHLEHAKEMLTVHGQMMMVAPSGITFRKEKQIESLREAFRIQVLPAQAFKESGTGANTVLAWYSPDAGLEPRFQEAKQQPDERSQPPEQEKTAYEAAINILRVFRHTDNVIDTTIADMERYQANRKAGLLLEWGAQQGEYEGWPNQSTWMVHILVTQNRLAYETMCKIMPTLKGTRARRATALHLMWTHFSAETGISAQFRAAFNKNQLSRDAIDWSALLDEWE